MLKVISDCIGFALLRSVIGLENSRRSLDQSDTKLKPITTCRPRFPALQAVCLFFSPDWLFRIFFFLLIGHCDYYDFGHSVEESALMYTKLQCH